MLSCHELNELEQCGSGLSRPLLIFVSGFAFLLCSFLSLDPLVQQSSHPLSWSLYVQEVCLLVLFLCSILRTGVLV